MIIKKELKFVSFSWDTELKMLAIITDKNPTGIADGVALSRIEMFSLMRFIIRVAQKGKPRKSKQLDLLKGGEQNA